MTKKILVAYASRTGTTTGVAEAIGETLRARGAEVDVKRFEDVNDMAPYDAVVAGSAIQDRQWLPEALQFVRAHQAELRRKPFAAFMVCMTMSIDNESFHEGVREWLDPVRALVEPVAEGYFAGALDIEQVPSFRQRLMFRISVATGVWSEGDHRDWEAIRDWANEIAPKLQ